MADRPGTSEAGLVVRRSISRWLAGLASRRFAGNRMRRALPFALFLPAGCGAERPPPPPAAFQGLPVTGDLAFARAHGFNRCIEDTTAMRCRRNGVTLFGVGPLNAALDLEGGDGSGGFDHLILWHDRDQNALFGLTEILRRQGWDACYTGEGHRGDQKIYTRAGVPVKLSMDLSYWGKRRLRVIPLPAGTPSGC